MGMRIRVSPGAAVLVVGAVLTGLWEAWRGGLGEIWGRVWPWLVVCVAAALHELGHLAAARAVGGRIRGLRLERVGARVELGGLLSYGGEALVALGGPLANVLSAAVALPMGHRSGGEGGWLLFAAASLVLGGVNLLPVGTLDGGRVLRCAVARRWGEGAADSVSGAVTGVCLMGLWLLAAYALLRWAQMLSLFIFSFCLLLRSLEGR